MIANKQNMTGLTPRFFWKGFLFVMNAFEMARKRGYKAAECGFGVEACPYPALRQENGKATFSVGFRNAWLTGFQSFKQLTLFEESGSEQHEC